MSRRVLVTGASSGLGAALARRLTEAGDRVIGADLTVPEDSDALRLDITSEADWEVARDYVETVWGGLDLLVNNAGVAGGGRLDVCTTDEWRRLFEVNLLGMVRGIRTFTPMLKQQRSGHVVNVASLAGLVHPAGMASYNAVKAAVVALTETVGHELAPYGVTASVVCPSYFRTGLMSSMHDSDTAVAEVVGGFVERAPLSADEVADAVVAGIDAGEELILPDEAAREAHRLKREDPEGYAATMRAGAEKLARLGSPR